MLDRATATDGGDADAPPDVDDADHTLVIDFEYADESRARTVADSVRVEVADVPGDRSRARVDRDGRVVGVDIGADDLVALRAGVNTWLRLVGVAEEVAGVAAEHRGTAAGEPARNDD